MGIVYGEAALLAGHGIHGDVFLFAVLELEHGVAVAEGSALDVFARDAHAVAVLKQGSVGEVLGHAPVQSVAVKYHGMAVSEQANHFIQKLFALWQGGERPGGILNKSAVRAGIDGQVHAGSLGWRVGHPLVFHKGNNHVFGDLLGLVKVALEHFFKLGLHLFDHSGMGRALGKQFSVVDFAGVWVGCDGLVQEGLGEARFVALVVAVLAVAEQVDEDVAAKKLPVLHGKAHGMHNRLYVVSVDVKHWSEHHLCHVGTVDRGAGVEVVRGESDLVVNDHVNGSARGIAVKALHLNHFIENSLARYGCVAVNLNR